MIFFNPKSSIMFLKSIASLAFFSAISISAFAQPTLTAANSNPTLSDAFAVVVCDDIGVAPGSSGAAVTWDFTFLHGVSPDTTRVKSCLSVVPACNPDFAGSNIVLSGPTVTSSNQNYYYAGTDRLSLVGYHIASDTSLTLSNPADQLRYPFTYGDSFTDTSSGIFKLGIVTAHHTGTIDVSADGYGTLILPGRTDNNVLRVHSTQVFSDSANLFGTPVIETYQISSYEWYKADYHSPILTLHHVTQLGSPTPSEYYFVAYSAAQFSGVAEINNSISELQVTPNPSSGLLNIAYSTDYKQRVVITLTDIVGRDVEVVSDKATAGKQNITINTTSYAKGVYILRMQAGGVTKSRKVVFE